MSDFFFFFFFNLGHIYGSPHGNLWGIKIIFLFLLLAMLAFFIHHLTVRAILTQYQKVSDLLDIFKRLETKLIYSVKVSNQICDLPL